MMTSIKNIFNNMKAYNNIEKNKALSFYNNFTVILFKKRHLDLPIKKTLINRSNLINKYETIF